MLMYTHTPSHRKLHIVGMNVPCGKSKRSNNSLLIYAHTQRVHCGGTQSRIVLPFGRICDRTTVDFNASPPAHPTPTQHISISIPLRVNIDADRHRCRHRPPPPGLAKLNSPQPDAAKSQLRIGRGARARLAHDPTTTFRAEQRQQTGPGENK